MVFNYTLLYIWILTHNLKAMSDTKKPIPTAGEMTHNILKAVGKENDPIRILIELSLSKWESQIRLNQLAEDSKMTSKVLSETFKKESDVKA